MVNLATARQSLSHLSTYPPGFTALFIGATSGVGKGTLKQLAKYLAAPRVYIVGRSERAAEPQLAELRTLNPQGDFIFIETEVSLIKNVDRLCDQIKAKEKKLDLIVLSPGFLSFEGRKDTVEGIDTLAALQYYARLRVIYNLLPLLAVAPAPRVVCVLSGGKERAIDLNDLELRKNYSLIGVASHSSTMVSVSLEHLAESCPSIAFIHYYPGFVNTGQIDRFLQTAQGIWSWPAWVARWTIVPVVSVVGYTIDQAGEMGLFIATSAKYPPAERKVGVETGSKLPQGVEISNSSIMKDGGRNGVYLLDSRGESAGGNSVLENYRAEGTDKKIWEATEAVWTRALRSHIAPEHSR